MRLTLTLACNAYDRTLALQTGAIAPEGIALNYVQLSSGELFERQARHAEFDVAEFSLSTHALLHARGDRRLVGLPVFPSRRFRHSDIYIHTGAGIREPRELIGKRIGTAEYQQTAAVWQRGMLHHDHGVTPESVEWCLAPLNTPGPYEERISFELPPTIRTRTMPPTESLDSLLARGEIDAVIASRPPRSFARGADSVARLFPDYQPVEVAYYRRTGIFPIMHMVVLKREVYERAPWIAQSLYKAFVQAKAAGAERLREIGPSFAGLPWLQKHLEETDALLGTDPYPYGLQPNRAVLATFLQYSREQGLLDRTIAVEDLFAPETHDTAGAHA